MLGLFDRNWTQAVNFLHFCDPLLTFPTYIYHFQDLFGFEDEGKETRIFYAIDKMHSRDREKLSLLCHEHGLQDWVLILSLRNERKVKDLLLRKNTFRLSILESLLEYAVFMKFESVISQLLLMCDLELGIEELLRVMDSALENCWPDVARWILDRIDAASLIKHHKIDGPQHTIFH